LDCQRIIKIVTDSFSGEGWWSHRLNHINGHRLPVTMAVYGMIGWLSNWSDLAFALVTFSLAAVSYYAMCRVIRETVTDPVKKAWVMMIGAWVIFSPLRISNWMMSWGIMWPLIDVFVWVGLAVAVSPRLGWARRNLLCGLCALLGSHTLMQGLLLWGVFPVALQAKAWVEGRPFRLRWWLLWVGAGLLVGASYFNFGLTPIKTWGDAESSVPGLFTGALSAAFSVLRFGLQVLTTYGTPIGPTLGGIPGAAWVPLLLIFSAALLLMLNLRSRPLHQSLATGVWGAVALYALASCFLIMVGRHKLAWLETYADLSRYHFASLFLALAVSAAVLITNEKGRLAGWIVAFGIGCCLWQASLVAITAYPPTRARTANQRAVFPLEIQMGVYSGGFASTPPALSRRGVYSVPLSVAEILPTKGTSEVTSALPGAIESVTCEHPGNRWLVKGWATTPDGRRKPDAVALFLVSPESRLIGFSGPAEHSEAASHHRAGTGQDAAGWSVAIPPDSLPEGSGRLEAYVIEGRTGKLHRVGKALEWQGHPDAGFKVNLLAP